VSMVALGVGVGVVKLKLVYLACRDGEIKFIVATLVIYALVPRLHVLRRFIVIHEPHSVLFTKVILDKDRLVGELGAIEVVVDDMFNL
jgi:hypothetical protein